MLNDTGHNVFQYNTELINNKLQPASNTLPGDKDSIGMTVNHTLILHHDSSLNADSVFANADRRDSQITAETKTIIIPIKQNNTFIADTNQLSYIPDFPGISNSNFPGNNYRWDNIYNAISRKDISNHFATAHFHKSSNLPAASHSQYTLKQTPDNNYGFDGKVLIKNYTDWLPLVILFSLYIFSFIKVVYNKYIVQVLYSLINYQAAVRLLRDRNVLFRNMAVVLNFVFTINAGLFVYFLIDYFKLGQLYSNSLLCFLLYSFLIFIFFNLKFIICKIVGYVFSVNDIFEEYTHNEKLSNKNIGLLLFPVIILIPYVPTFMKPVILYAGLAIIIVLLAFRAFRAFQIIIRREVSSFYLILYLCTIEILPFIIMVKYSKAMI